MAKKSSRTIIVSLEQWSHALVSERQLFRAQEGNNNFLIYFLCQPFKNSIFVYDP